MFPDYNVNHEQDSEDCEKIINPPSIQNCYLPKNSENSLKIISYTRQFYFHSNSMTKFLAWNGLQNTEAIISHADINCVMPLLF